MPGIATPSYRGVTVDVRAINTTADLVCTTDTICRPRIAGHEQLNLPTTAWLIDHPPSNTAVLFDCGVRKDFYKFHLPAMEILQSCVPHMHVPHDVGDILVRNGIGCENLGWYPHSAFVNQANGPSLL